jgi:hypothetical protein
VVFGRSDTHLLSRRYDDWADGWDCRTEREDEVSPGLLLLLLLLLLLGILTIILPVTINIMEHVRHQSHWSILDPELRHPVLAFSHSLMLSCSHDLILQPITWISLSLSLHIPPLLGCVMGYQIVHDLP